MNLEKIYKHKYKIISALTVCCLAILFYFVSVYYTQTIIEDDIPLASSNVEAMFYVENPESGSVTCVGDGLINTTSSISNNEKAVSDAVVTAPDYSAIIGKDLIIQWNTIKIEDNTYEVYGQIVPNNSSATASKTFSTVNDMKSADIPAGSIVSTKGFYSENDGGGANYYISSEGTVDNIFTFGINNGLLATIQPEDNTINIDQLGAKADGVSDDVEYIQAAFDSGYTVSFGQNKTYKIINNGLAIRNALFINGNNATIFIDDSYNPSSSAFQKFVFRSGNKEISNISIKNLSLDCKITSPRYSGSNYLCMFQPHYISDVALNNFNIHVSESNNIITNFWMYYGCDSIVLDGCTFTNDTICTDGGILFIDSEKDTKFNKYNAFKKISLNNCHFEGHCSDEAIALWGPNNINFTMANSTIKWTHAKSDHYSRPINISVNKETNALYNVTFDNCNITADSPNADSLIGVGSISPMNLNLLFKGCSLDAKVRDSLLHFAILPKTPSGISTFDFTTDKYNINFDNCNINCSKPITGSNNLYASESNGGWAIDCNFDNCNINCNYCFAFIERYSSTKYYYVPTINVNDSTINVNNAIGFIYKSTYNAIADIDLDSCKINAQKLSTVSSYRYKSNAGNGITQTNISDADTTIADTKLNSKSVDE